MLSLIGGVNNAQILTYIAQFYGDSDLADSSVIDTVESDLFRSYVVDIAKFWFSGISNTAEFWLSVTAAPHVLTKQYKQHC